MKKLLIAAPLLILLMLAACSFIGNSDEEQLQLYFLSTADHGPAISSEVYPYSNIPSPEQLISALISGPESEELSSPFPRGLSLRGVQLENGHLVVNFSEQYSGLSDVSLTLADYCVTLTLCQLDGVDSVEITASGLGSNYRSHQILTPEEAILAAQE